MSWERMPVQRVRRVIRKVDPWTMLKVSLVFNGIMALVFILGTLIFWTIFVSAGIPDRINELALLVGIENGIQPRRACLLPDRRASRRHRHILFTGFFTLGAVVYNLISDLVGGIEIVVLEESHIPHTTKPKVTLPVRRKKPVEAKAKRVPALPNVRAFTRKKSSPKPAPSKAPPSRRPVTVPAPDDPDELEKTGT